MNLSKTIMIAFLEIIILVCSYFFCYHNSIFAKQDLLFFNCYYNLSFLFHFINFKDHQKHLFLNLECCRFCHLILNYCTILDWLFPCFMHILLYCCTLCCHLWHIHGASFILLININNIIKHIKYILICLVNKI